MSIFCVCIKVVFTFLIPSNDCARLRLRSLRDIFFGTNLSSSIEDAASFNRLYFYMNVARKKNIRFHQILKTTSKMRWNVLMEYLPIILHRLICRWAILVLVALEHVVMVADFHIDRHRCVALRRLSACHTENMMTKL